MMRNKILVMICTCFEHSNFCFMLFHVDAHALGLCEKPTGKVSEFPNNIPGCAVAFAPVRYFD